MMERYKYKEDMHGIIIYSRKIYMQDPYVLDVLYTHMIYIYIYTHDMIQVVWCNCTCRYHELLYVSSWGHACTQSLLIGQTAISGQILVHAIFNMYTLRKNGVTVTLFGGLLCNPKSAYTTDCRKGRPIHPFNTRW